MASERACPSGNGKSDGEQQPCKHAGERQETIEAV
jgi:hypothetical protein